MKTLIKILIALAILLIGCNTEVNEKELAKELAKELKTDTIFLKYLGHYLDYSKVKYIKQDIRGNYIIYGDSGSVELDTDSVNIFVDKNHSIITFK